MHIDYKDITDKLGPPKWWDEHAVPRYCDFSPDEVADIYAKEVVLMKIACQDCGEIFYVAMSNPGYNRYTFEQYSFVDILKYMHYGDPPNNGCCGAGPSMNCEDLNIVQFWKKDYKVSFDWIRVPENEVDLSEIEIPF
jgi:hypothetical protein